MEMDERQDTHLHTHTIICAHTHKTFTHTHKHTSTHSPTPTLTYHAPPHTQHTCWQTLCRVLLMVADCGVVPKKRITMHKSLDECFSLR